MFCRVAATIRWLFSFLLIGKSTEFKDRGTPKSESTPYSVSFCPQISFGIARNSE